MTHGHSLPKEISLSLAFQVTMIGAYYLGKVKEECTLNINEFSKAQNLMLFDPKSYIT